MPNHALSCMFCLFRLSAFHCVYLYKIGSNKTYMFRHDQILQAEQCGMHMPKKRLYCFSSTYAANTTLHLESQYYEFDPRNYRQYWAG